MTFRQLLIRPLGNPLATAFLSLILRIALAGPFWLSGRTKVVENSLFSISDTTYLLFENDYSGVPLPPAMAAIAATVAEHVLPILLALGLGTRLAAAGLVIMTMVIQLFVYPDAWWGLHFSWVALGMAILVLGPGRLSLDAQLFDRRRP